MSHNPELRRWRGMKHTVIGMTAIALLVGGVGSWSAFASIAGAVVANGRLQVEANRQAVQHPDGGVVQEILVRDGDPVSAGQVLLRFDSELLAAEQSIIDNRLFDAAVRIARLTAERDGQDKVTFAPALSETASANDDRGELLSVQQRLFAARTETFTRQLTQLTARQEQNRGEIAGLQAQQAATETQLELIERELDGQRKLFEKGYAPIIRVYELERTQAELQGRIGELASEIAETEGQIAEIEIEKLRLAAARRQEAITELRALRAEQLELRERQRVTAERLSRLELRAPRDGIVIDMAVHALRSVVRPAEPIVHVVPTDSSLLVEARVSPAHVDDIYPGQPANLRFSAFNARTTPQIGGIVHHVSADALADETGASFYLVKLEINQADVPNLGDQLLVPGMPVDVFLRTEDRSPFSYLAKPFTDYFAKAMRES